jgi:hypothetical protein
VTCTLFPEFEKRTNQISAGDKQRVSDLYHLLEKAREAGGIPAQIFSISDSDGEVGTGGPDTRLCWDVYHIENYLVEPTFILSALRSIGVTESAVTNEVAVKSSLQSCAQQTIPELVQHQLRVRANRLLVSCVNLNCDPKRLDAAVAIGEAIRRSGDRIKATVDEKLSPETLAEWEATLTAEYEAALTDGNWMKRFRGRDILKRFVGRFGNGLSYEHFRELILSKMRDERYQPAGMKEVIDKILTANVGTRDDSKPAGVTVGSGGG